MNTPTLLTLWWLLSLIRSAHFPLEPVPLSTLPVAGGTASHLEVTAATVHPLRAGTESPIRAVALGVVKAAAVTDANVGRVLLVLEDGQTRWLDESGLLNGPSLRTGAVSLSAALAWPGVAGVVHRLGDEEHVAFLDLAQRRALGNVTLPGTSPDDESTEFVAGRAAILRYPWGGTSDASLGRPLAVLDLSVFPRYPNIATARVSSKTVHGLMSAPLRHGRRVVLYFVRGTGIGGGDDELSWEKVVQTRTLPDLALVREWRFPAGSPVKEARDGGWGSKDPGTPPSPGTRTAGDSGGNTETEMADPERRVRNARVQLEWNDSVRLSPGVGARFLVDAHTGDVYLVMDDYLPVPPRPYPVFAVSADGETLRRIRPESPGVAFARPVVVKDGRPFDPGGLTWADEASSADGPGPPVWVAAAGFLWQLRSDGIVKASQKTATLLAKGRGWPFPAAKPRDLFVAPSGRSFAILGERKASAGEFRAVVHLTGFRIHL